MSAITVSATRPQLPWAEISPRGFKIYFQDDSERQRSHDNATSTGAMLAKKALKDREVYDRVTGVDVTSPSFDASKFLGVDSCHTSNLKAHCARAQ